MQLLVNSRNCELMLEASSIILGPGGRGIAQGSRGVEDYLVFTNACCTTAKAEDSCYNYHVPPPSGMPFQADL